MKTLINRASGVALGALAVVAVAACNSDVRSQDPPMDAITPNITETEASGAPTDTAETAAPTNEPPGPDEGGAELTHQEPAARAAEGALAAAPGDVISIDPESGDVWSVLVRTSDGDGIELYVNAATGAIERQHAESLPSLARDGAPAVSAIDAIDIVLGAVPEAEIRELDLGASRGITIWEILGRDSAGLIEFYVDADNGEILKEERDD